MPVIYDNPSFRENRKPSKQFELFIDLQREWIKETEKDMYEMEVTPFSWFQKRLQLRRKT